MTAFVRSSSNGYISSATTEFLMALPTPISPGDRLIAAFAVDGDNANTDFVLHGTGGWSQIGVANQGSVRIEVWELSAAGSEDATITTVSAGTAETGAYKIWALGDVLAGQASEAATSVSVSAVVPFAELTPTGGAKDYVFIGVAAMNDEDVETYSSGYGNTGIVPATEDSPRIAWQRRELNTDVHQADPILLSASDQWGSIIIAVHPALVGATNMLWRRRRYA